MIASIGCQRITNQAIIHSRYIPKHLIAEPRVYIRGFRSALRMKQIELAKRCSLSRSYINRLEKGKKDARVCELYRIFNALFCDLLILPIPRKRPGDALWERRRVQFRETRLWE